MPALAKVETLIRDLSEDQIRRLLRARKHLRRVDELDAEISALRNEIRDREHERERVTRKIDRITRSAVAPRKRARRNGTLAEAVIATLRRKGSLGLTDLARAVLKNGYSTASGFDNFRVSVAHTLRRMRDTVTKDGRGYSVK